MTKLVIRLLDAQNQLLGWTAVMALARGDGQLWAQEQVFVPVDKVGELVVVSVHWADVNVETRQVFDAPMAVAPGSRVDLGSGVLLRAGNMPGELPPVIVRDQIIVAPPMGSLAGAGTR